MNPTTRPQVSPAHHPDAAAEQPGLLARAGARRHAPRRKPSVDRIALITRHLSRAH